MKKTLLVLLALLLCVSVLFTACNDDEKTPDNDVVDNNDDQTDDGGNNGNAGNELNKTTVIQNFNKIDLYAMYETVKEGLNAAVDLEELENFDFRTIEQQVTGTITMDQQVVNGLLTLKDGAIYGKLIDTTPGSDATEEIYVYITDAFEFIEFYLDENGKWVANDGYYGDDSEYDDYYPVEPYTTTQDEDDSEDSFEELLGFDFEILKRIIIPAVSADQLTEKDGMLVLDNSYFVNVATANFDLLLELVGSEGAPTKEEFAAELTELIDMLGLEVAFTANDTAITGVRISLSSEEEGAYISFGVKLTDDAKALKSAEISVHTTDESVDYLTGFTLKLENTLDGDSITAADITVIANWTEYDYHDSVETDNGYEDEFVVICNEITCKISVKDLVEGKDPVLTATAGTKVEKAILVKETYSYDTYDSTYTTEEVSTDGYGMEFEATLTITADVDAATCDIDFTANIDGVEIIVKGTWLGAGAPTAPAIPDEIVDYVNGLNG